MGLKVRELSFLGLKVGEIVRSLCRGQGKHSMTRPLGPLVAGIGCLREQEFGSVFPDSPREGPAGNQARVETPRVPERWAPGPQEMRREDGVQECGGRGADGRLRLEECGFLPNQLNLKRQPSSGCALGGHPGAPWAGPSLRPKHLFEVEEGDELSSHPKPISPLSPHSVLDRPREFFFF